MQRILILLITVSIHLCASYVVVDDSIVDISGDGNTIIHDISATFDTLLEVSQSNVLLEIPIYVNSDATDAINMEISNISSLKNSDNEVISTTLSYHSIDGASVSISDGTSFTLLNSNEGIRDGDTVLGYITVTVSTVSDLQTVGDYSLSANMRVQLEGGDYSASSFLSIDASVALVTVASFNSTSNEISGERFIGDSVAFGNFRFEEQNEIIKPLYIKNNSLLDFKISFETKALKSMVDPDNYSIGMSYYYNDVLIANNTQFTALSGKNSGSTKVGDMKFKTETISSSLISGGYQATLSITITLE